MIHNQNDAAKILREAAQVYKVDVDVISATVKQEIHGKGEGQGREGSSAKTSE